jgi:hypothetical protein
LVVRKYFARRVSPALPLISPGLVAVAPMGGSSMEAPPN